MPQQGYQSGGYDWLATWRRMYDEERAQAENSKLPGFIPQADCWSGQANRFAAAAQRAEQPDGFMHFLLPRLDRKSTRLNSSYLVISYAVFCLKKKNNIRMRQ